MSFSMSRETAIRLLVEANILEEIDGTHEHKAGVVRFTRSGSTHGHSVGMRFCCLRIPRNTLIRFYDDRKHSMNQNYISALYSIGIGVPRDHECAQFWHHMSNSNCKCEAYKRFSAVLKAQLKETIGQDYYVYSNDVLKQNRLVDNVKGKTRCVLLYKSSATGYNLHNVIVEGHSIVYEIRPARLGIPTSLSVNVKSNVKYVARLGTLQEGGDYDLSMSILDAVKELSSVYPDEELVTNFSKQVFFDHKSTIIVDYNWRISQLKRRI